MADSTEEDPNSRPTCSAPVYPSFKPVKCAVVINQIENRDDAPSLRDLNRYVVKRYAVIWKDVGIELGLELPALESIEENYPKNVATCFQKTLIKWLNLVPGATWKMLEVAITNVKRQDLLLNPVENLYGEDEDDSGLVVMNESTTVPPSVSGMQMTGPQQPSDDCYDFNEPMQPLPTATTNVLPVNVAPTTEASTQTSAITAAVPAAVSAAVPAAEHKIKVKFKNDHEGTTEVDLLSKEIKTIHQVKNEVAEKERVSKDHLIFTVHDEEFGSSVILEDEDLLEKWKLDKGGFITCSKVIELKEATREKQLCDVLQKSYEEWFLQKHGAFNADDNGDQRIKVISAMIREKITAEKEERFKVILMGAGTKYNVKCSSKDFNGTCDGHAEALCYETIVHYFLKLIRKRNFNVLLLSREGFQLNPEYKFHLFISHPPCGFMTNESEPLISWKTPFVEEPHVLTCSSKIIVNSYLGIQGPLICLFAKPLYISEVIVLNTDDTITEKAHKKFEEAASKLAQQSLFSFHPPDVKVLKAPQLFGIEYIGAKNHKAQEGSLTCIAVLRNPDDDCNPVFSVRVLKKNNEKTQGSKGTEKVHDNEKLFDINDLVWSKHPIKLHFKEFDEIHKAIIKNLMIFQELTNLSKKLEEDCGHTASNLKEKIGKTSAEVTRLVEEMDYKCYKKVNLAATNFIHDVINLKDKKEDELRMIEDIQVLIKQLSKNGTGYIPMCCCWKRYHTFLQRIEKKQSSY